MSLLPQQASPNAKRELTQSRYEEVYLRAYDGVADARASLGRYLDLYNGKRPHSSLAARTPDQAYFSTSPQRAAA